MTNSSLQSKPDISLLNKDLQSEALSKYQISRNNKYKTIQELNPNPNLLSKKAIRTRKLKMEQKFKETKNSPLHVSETQYRDNDNYSLGGRQLQLIKSSTLSSKFDMNSTKNVIKLPPRIITDDPLPIRSLGSRQKQLAGISKTERSSNYNKPVIEKDSAKLAEYIASRFQDTSYKKKQIFPAKKQAFEKSPLASFVDRRHDGLPLPSKVSFKFSHPKDSVANLASTAEKSLGSRQLQLLKSKPTKVKSSRPNKSQSKRTKKGRVRKVLKGRRRISSSELRLKSSNFFF